MSCRHSLALGTCTVCYPGTGTYEPEGPGDSMDGPGAVPATDRERIELLEARIAELEEPPVVPEGWEVTEVIRSQRNGWALSCGDSVVGMWYPDTGQVRITTLAPAEAIRALAWAIEHDQRPPHAGDKKRADTAPEKDNG